MQTSHALRLGFLLFSVWAGTAAGQQARWVVTNRWEGFGSQHTERFWVNGATWRVRYRPVGRGIFQIAVYDTDNLLLDMATNQNRPAPLAGHATLKGRGARYLGITGVDTSWEVTIEQFLTAIEEWHLRQLLKQPPPQLLKVGVWTGDDGSSTYEFAVTSDSWVIRHNHTGDGLFQIFVEDGDGFVAIAANNLRASAGSSWVHKPGRFTMRVQAEGVQWTVEVLSEARPGEGG